MVVYAAAGAGEDVEGVDCHFFVWGRVGGEEEVGGCVREGGEERRWVQWKGGGRWHDTELKRKRRCKRMVNCSCDEMSQQHKYSH